jgi:hypothetical protein
VDGCRSVPVCLERISNPRFRAIAHVALTGTVNRWAVQRRRRWDDRMLLTPEGQNELVMHHVLHGGVGELTPGQAEYYKRLEA